MEFRFTYIDFFIINFDFLSNNANVRGDEKRSQQQEPQDLFVDNPWLEFIFQFCSIGEYNNTDRFGLVWFVC